MKRKTILANLIFIAIAAALVCLVLWWIKPAHTCESDSMFYNLSRECPR